VILSKDRFDIIWRRASAIFCLVLLHMGMDSLEYNDRIIECRAVDSDAAGDKNKRAEASVSALCGSLNIL
jgi:hypothetical protein